MEPGALLNDAFKEYEVCHVMGAGESGMYICNCFSTIAHTLQLEGSTCFHLCSIGPTRCSGESAMPLFLCLVRETRVRGGQTRSRDP